MSAAHGEPVSRKIIENATFNLVAWDGTWIWNEGKPADIPAFDGVRVVRLEPLLYRRSWSAGPKFPGMRAELELVRRLSQEEMASWTGKIQPTRKPTGGGRA
jgi:hypothetical protein